MSTYKGDSARRGRHAAVGSLVSIAVLGWLCAASVARGDCPEAPTEVVEVEVGDLGVDTAVAMDSCGRYTICWQEVVNSTESVLVQFYSGTGTVQGDTLMVSAGQSGFHFHYLEPSVAMSAGGLTRVDFIGGCDDCAHDFRPVPTLENSVFAWGNTPGQVGVPGRRSTAMIDKMRALGLPPRWPPGP
jgi:hypothetical protein